MKVVVYVVVLAALAAAEEAAEVPVVAKAAVQPFLHAEKLAAVDPASLKIRLFAAPKEYHAAKRRYDQETVQSLLKGRSVMVSFLDELAVTRRRKMQWESYLFPESLAFVYGYHPEDIAPLTEFLTNGRRKSMLFLSAFDTLPFNVNFAPFSNMHIPSNYYLNTALHTAERYSPIPHVVLLNDGLMKYNKLQLVGEMQVTTDGLRALEKKSSLQQGNQQTVASVAVTDDVVQQNGTKVAAEVPVVAAVPAVQSVGVAGQPLAAQAAQAAQATLLDVQSAQLNRTAAPAAQPVVKPAAHTGTLTAVNLTTLSYRLLTAPADYNAKYRQLDQETVQRVLNGPVMLSFRYKPDDTWQNRMQTYLFVNGLGDFSGFQPEDIAPLMRFVGNGQSKALLFLTAGSYMSLLEMGTLQSATYVPSYYNLKQAFRIEEDFTPFPQLILLEESDRDFSQLRQVGKIEWGLRAA